MATPNCSDLCTAAKCAELEARISNLEQHIELLEAAFSAHTQQSIPEAHQYTPEVTVALVIENGELISDVTVDRQSDFSVVPLPDNVIPSVTCDIFKLHNNEYLFKVGVNGEFDEDSLILEDPVIDITTSISSTNELEISLQYNDEFIYDSTPLPRYDVALDTFKIDDDSLAIVVQVGEERDETILHLPKNDVSKHVESNLKINGSYQGDYLTLTVADGESFDSTQIFIDAEVNNINNNGGGEVSCDGISQELQDCCAEILGAIAEVKNFVTIDVSDTVYSDYTCEFPTNEDEQLLLTYAEASIVEKEFTGKGIAGLNQRLIYLAKNQDAMYRDVCKAIDPITNIYRQDFYQFCNDSGISRNDYEDTPAGTELYEAAIEIYLVELASESKYGYLINAASEDENNSVILSAPSSYINGILADFALIQARNNSQALCALAEREPTDVVSIVASDRFVTKVSGRVLVLHFVTFDNYPKRNNKSGYRPVQIPAPKEEYDWLVDFNNLRWSQGNQFAELRFVEPYVPVSGWFKDADAANAYFDQILTLTEATEDDRVIPEHSNPKTAILEQLTRPYRAFIKSVNSEGVGICHAKYVPVLEADNGN